MGNADALKEVQAQINAGADGSLEYANAAVTIERAVSGESDSIERAIDAATQKQEADGKSVSTSQNVADAYIESADAADEFTEKLDSLIEKINEANGVGQDAISANAQWQAALAGLNEQVEKNGTSLNQATAEGSANAAALSDVAKAAQDAAAAQFEQDKTTMSAEEATKKYNETLSRSEEHTSELQSLMRISYAVF